MEEAVRGGGMRKIGLKTMVLKIFFFPVVFKDLLHF